MGCAIEKTVSVHPDDEVHPLLLRRKQALAEGRHLRHTAKEHRLLTASSGKKPSANGPRYCIGHSFCAMVVI